MTVAITAQCTNDVAALFTPWSMRRLALLALVLTEGSYADRAYAQGYLFQPGLTNGVR